jgi:hypothetical protein
MSCTKHFLGFRWEHHDWDRRVTHAENLTFRGTDMWSRKVPVPEVVCYTQYVCRSCGTVRDEGYCNCDQARGDACQIRLAWLAEHGAESQGANSPASS